VPEAEERRDPSWAWWWEHWFAPKPGGGGRGGGGRADYLEGCRQKRNIAGYDYAGGTTKQNAGELIW